MNKSPGHKKIITLAAILYCIAEQIDVHMYDIGLCPCTNFERNAWTDGRSPIYSPWGLTNKCKCYENEPLNPTLIPWYSMMSPELFFQARWKGLICIVTRLQNLTLHGVIHGMSHSKYGHVKLWKGLLLSCNYC